MPGEGAAAEGHDVDALELVLEALAVAHEGRHVGEDPVGEADGLGGLEVREARHEQVDVLLGQGRHGQEELGEEALKGWWGWRWAGWGLLGTGQNAVCGWCGVGGSVCNARRAAGHRP